MANGIRIEVATAGEGPAVLLLHGFPHTWRVWSPVIPALARDHRVIAPDLRGLGGTTRATTGYDAETLSRDAEGLLASLGLAQADVVGIDAGGPVAVMLGLRRPEMARRLAVLECSVPGLPSDFRPPWWFGFHSVPGLAERVLTGHEGEYLDFFYEIGSRAGVPAPLRDAFVSAYSGTDSLRCAFEHYRSMPQSANQFQARTAETRLTMPVLAIGSAPVGDVTHRQLAPIGDDVRAAHLPDCGHIIPVDRPAELAALLRDFL